MTPKQMQAIIRHGETLKAIFKLPPTTNLVELCKQLRRLETKAHKAAEDWCNGDIDQGQSDAIDARTLANLHKILGPESLKLPIFINHDPRGYALKLADDWTRFYNTTHEPRLYQDWGGYGILAPEIGKEG